MDGERGAEYFSDRTAGGRKLGDGKKIRQSLTTQ